MGIGEQEAAWGFDGDDLAAAMELPLEGLVSARIAEVKAVVLDQVGELFGATVFCEIRRGGDGNDVGFEELSRY